MMRKLTGIFLTVLVLVASMAERDAAAQRAPRDREEIRLSFAPIVRRAAPSVVNVYATRQRREIDSPFAADPFFRRFFENSPFGAPGPRDRTSLGSGVIVDRSGVVVTNHHVIRDADNVRIVMPDGQEYEADILLRDERTDLAVLQIKDGRPEFQALEFGDSDTLEVGDLVLAIGNPFGVGQTVTSGIVSALARTNVGISDLSFFIQTDAAINPGNSGGALVDMRGNIVGINTAIFSRSGGSIGIGFAIPSNMVQSVVAQALSGSSEVERPWIGATFQEVTAEIAQSLGLGRPRGALVTRVERNSPAERAGLEIGDLVLRVDRQEIANPSALEYRLALLGIGRQTRFTILRRGERIHLTVALVRAPETRKPRAVQIEGGSPLAGATVANLSPRLAQRLRLPTDSSGVAVIDVDPRSPAARYGFRPGDIVLRAQGRDIEDTEQLAEIAGRSSRLWRLQVDRRGRISNLVIGG